MSQRTKKGLRVAAYVLAAATFIVLLFPLSGEALGGVSTFLSKVIGAVFSVVPFSVFTLFVLLVPVFIGLFIYRIVKNAKRHTLRAFFKNTCTMLCVIFVWFGWTMGLNYRKTSIYEKLDYNEAEYTAENVVSACNSLIEVLNYNAAYVEFDGLDRALVLPEAYTKSRVTSLAKQTVKRHDFDFLSDIDLNVKQTFVPRLLLSFGYDGIYFPFFAELNVDSAVSVSSLCTLVVHEILHSKGVMNEGETSFLAQYICINSDDRILRYCGSYEAVMHGFIKLNSIDPSLTQACAKNITDEYLRKRMVALAAKASNSGGSHFLYDIYLRLNYVSEGSASYDNDIYGWVRYFA